MTPSNIPNGVSLREVLGDGVRLATAGDMRVASCTHDWQQVRRGDVFVALCEATDDGHDSSLEAVERGASAVVCERQLPIFKVPQFVVDDSRDAYGRLCQAIVGNPSSQLKIIGVTGTSGKSTVARLLASVFREAGFQAASLDSFGYCDAWEDRPSSSGMLTPPALARALAKMVSDGVSHAMLEVSSRNLSQGLLAGVGLDAVSLTNVGRDHMDWHSSIENYRQAKRRIFDHLNDDGVATLNADCPTSAEILCDVQQPALTFAMKNPAEITADLIECHVNEQFFVLTAGDESVAVRTAMIGDHHIYNCLAAATTALAYGIDLPTIARGLESLDRLPGRLELVRCGQEFTTLVDAASTPDTLRAALRTARQLTSGRLICVFGTPCENEHTTRPVLGRVLGAMADVVVVTTAPHEDGASCATICSGLADPRKAELIPNRIDAIRWALDEARAGDTVVVAGLGDMPYGTTDHEGFPVTDHLVAERLLRGAFDSLSPLAPVA